MKPENKTNFVHKKEPVELEDFVCGVCSERFYTQEDLDLHIKNVHQILDEDEEIIEEEPEKFICDICGREFDTEKGLNIHISMAHGDKGENE
ncbi:MAG: C2H2-type zinc finger protein [Elusimicrobiota bacterium]